MPDRRSFLAMMGAASLFGMAARASERQARFDEARAGDNRLLGWAAPLSDRLESARLEVEGILPEALSGVLRRNGPAAHSRHGLRYRHWFDGDGMIQEFRFDGTGIAHRGRMIETPKLSLEDEAARRLVPAFGTHPEGSGSLAHADDMNAANISLLDHAGELMALWEGGSASIIDRETLAWTAFKSWGEDLTGLPFTAHPKVEADGTLWAFGCAFSPYGAIILYHIGADGEPVKAAVIPVEPLGMVHDFVVTRDFLVIVIPPFVHEMGRGGTFLDSHVWKPELGSRTLVVSKDDFSDRRWVQLPAGFGFHHGNGWNEADGTIRFDLCLAPDTGLLEDAFAQVMEGVFVETATPRYTQFALHADGSFEVSGDGSGADFPRIAPARVARRNRYVYTISSSGEPGWLPGIIEKRDLESAALERFDFSPGTIVEEHIFVPFPDARAEDDGWLVGTFLDWKRERSGVSIFDARGIADGPLCRGWLPYPLPLGFHGQFSTT